MKVDLRDIGSALSGHRNDPIFLDSIKRIVVGAVKLSEARRTANVVRLATDILDGHFPEEMTIKERVAYQMGRNGQS
jgi:hypothetical protein